MVEGADKPGPSVAFEVFRFVGLLALVILLGSVCVLAQFVAAVKIHPWVGVLVAIGSFWVWSRVGPPPGPGQLSGALCLGGHAAILGALLVCARIALR